MSLAFLLGAAKGAADRYVEELDSFRELEQERKKKRAERRAAMAQKLNDKDTLYVATPEMQVLLDKNNIYGANRFDQKTFQDNVAGIRAMQDETGEFQAAVYAKNTAFENLNGLLEYDMHQIRSAGFMQKDPTIAEEVERHEAATIAQLSELIDSATTKDPVTGVPVSLSPIHNKIAGWDQFSPDKKQYVNGLIDKAFGYRPGQGAVIGLTDSVGDYTPYSYGDTMTLHPNFRITENGTKIHYNSVPPEAINAVRSMSDSHTIYDNPDVWTRRTVMNNIAREKGAGNIPYGKSVALQTEIHNQFVDGTLEQNGGVISGSPSVEKALRDDLEVVVKKAGVGEAIQLFADALPDSALYREGRIPPGSIENIKEVRTATYEEKVLGIATADDRSKFNQRATTLEELADNARQIINLIGQGAQLGITGKAVAFIGAARSQMEAFKRMFGDEIGDTSVFDNALASLQANMDTSVEGNRKAQIENATKIKDFLVKQLSYNIARSLESSTGNARLSDIDVKKAEEALGLTGLLQNEAAAIKVLELIEGRARRDLEYHNAMSSRDLKKMQAGRFIRRMYGADSMISVADEHMSDLSSAGSAFMRAIEEEALRTGIVSERGQIYTGEQPGRVAN